MVNYYKRQTEEIHRDRLEKEKTGKSQKAKKNLKKSKTQREKRCIF